MTLGKHGKGKRYKVHRLVAITFVENPNSFTEVNHKDGNKLNNTVNNLEWCTRSQNVKHSYDTKLKRGSKTKLSETDVKVIKRVLNERGYESSCKDLMTQFDVDRATIWCIYKGRTWKNVT